MGCNCGGSSYGMAEGQPAADDPFYWNGQTAPAPKPTSDTKKPASK